MIVLEEQCFLVTVSFNMSTLITTAFLNRQPQPFTTILVLLQAPLHYLTSFQASILLCEVSFRRIFQVIPLYLGSLVLPWLASDGPIIRIIYDRKFILLFFFVFHTFVSSSEINLPFMIAISFRAKKNPHYFSKIRGSFSGGLCNLCIFYHLTRSIRKSLVCQFTIRS